MSDDSIRDELLYDKESDEGNDSDHIPFINIKDCIPKKLFNKKSNILKTMNHKKRNAYYPSPPSQPFSRTMEESDDICIVKD